jgi:pimeloyl-ACP methyl ester carboxylesterase
MPAVFVHGVPDTHRVWRAVIARLRRDDAVALSLPGFGSEIPAGFDCTKDAYCEWLRAQLRRIEGPIDLVGHDWGGLLVVRAVSLEPTLVRTWTAGGALASALVAAGVPQADAAGAAEHLDSTMKRSILSLYRSAIHVGSEWVADLSRIQARGLVLWGERDPYAAPVFGSRLASRTNARFVPFSACSHWWQLERPDDVAQQLEGHWS